MALTPEQVAARQALGLPLTEDPPVSGAPAVPFAAGQGNAHAAPANLMAFPPMQVEVAPGKTVQLPAADLTPKPALPANPTMEQALGAANAVPQGGPGGGGPKPAVPVPDVKRDQPGAGAAGAAPSSTENGPLIPYGGSGGATTVAAHNQPLVDPAIQSNILGGYDQRAAAIEGRKGAEESRGREEAIGHLSQAEHSLAVAERQKSEDSRIREQADKDAASLKTMRDDMDKLSRDLSETKFDPTRGFSGWDNIRFGIAGALGGWLYGTGRAKSNFAIDQVNKLMEMELNKQYHEFEVKKGRMGDMENLYSKAYAVTKDREQAYKLAFSMGQEAMKSEADSLASQSNSKVALAAANQVKAQLDVDQAQNAVTKWEHDAKMNKWVPKTTSGGVDMAAVRKRAIEIRNHAATNGQDIDPSEAQRQAFMDVTGKDPYNRKDVPVKSYAKEDKEGKLPEGADPTIRAIAKLPKAMQKDALEEYQTRLNRGKVENFVTDVFKGDLGGPWDRRREVAEDRFLLELKKVAGKAGPGSSENDAKVLKTFMPQPNDSDQTRAYKQQQALGYLRNVTQTPTLDKLGLDEGPSAADRAAAAGAKPR